MKKVDLKLVTSAIYKIMGRKDLRISSKTKISGICDELEKIEIIMELEDKLNVDLDVDAIEKIKTIADIIDIFEKECLKI